MRRHIGAAAEAVAVAAALALLSSVHSVHAQQAASLTPQDHEVSRGSRQPPPAR